MEARIRHVVSKATTRDAEAYSGFQGTDLAALLASRGIRRAFVCGLATDYCVKATALDARRAGLDVVVIEDAIRGVEVQPGDCVKAIDEMKASAIVAGAQRGVNAGAIVVVAGDARNHRGGGSEAKPCGSCSERSSSWPV